MKRDGFTLLELLASVAIWTSLMGVMFGLITYVYQAADLQQAKTMACDEARIGMQRAVRELRQAAKASLSDVPSDSISYRIPMDIDGNGWAVDAHGKLELGPLKTLTRDYDDRNRDGLREEQLILVDGDIVFVLLNSLAPDEDVNANGILDEGEDLNRNSKLDHGVWFDSRKDNLRISIQTRIEYSTGRSATASLSEAVVPRN